MSTDSDKRPVELVEAIEMFGAYILGDFTGSEELLLKCNIRSLIFSFDTSSEVIRKAREHFKVCLDFQPFATHGNHFVENISGSRKDLKALGCPSSTGRENLFRLKNKLSSLEVDGVILDFVRFPSFAEADFYYSCFCKQCSELAGQLGYNFDSMKREVSKFKSLLDRGILELEMISPWLDFKRDVIARYVELFSEAADIEVEKHAFLFPPSLSRYVGQSYELLSNLLNKIHPMIYPEGDLGAACLGYEIAALASMSKVELPQIYNALDLQLTSNPLSFEMLKSKGLPAEVIGIEAERALGYKNAEPIITVASPEKTRSRIKIARQMGVKKLYLFGFSSKHRAAFEMLSREML